MKRLYEEKCIFDKTIASVVGYFVEIWDLLLSSLPAGDNAHSVLYNIFGISEEVHTSEENIFLFYMMRFWKEREDGRYKKYNTEDKMTIHYFMQYLRIKNYMFSCTVQTKTVRGLDYFQTQYYKKDSALNGLLGTLLSGNTKWDKRVAYWECAMRKQFQNSYLKKIEFRASIDENENDFRGNVRAFLCGYRNVLREDYCRKENGVYRVYREIPRVGIVYHLLKRKDNTVPEKCFLDSKEDIRKEYFGLQGRQYNDLIEIMRKLRDEVCGLERYIVGIDAASLENNTPVWVFSDVYERARDSRIEELGYGVPFTQSLRFTFHAGEDFRHILSGLRRIDEAVSFLKFHAGDRIGHGTALGVSVEKWRLHNPFVVMPRIEALENYIWAYYVLSQDSVNFQSTLMAYLERRAYDLAKEIYGSAQGISIMTLVEGYLLLFSMDKKRYMSNVKSRQIQAFVRKCKIKGVRILHGMVRK